MFKHTVMGCAAVRLAQVCDRCGRGRAAGAGVARAVGMPTGEAELRGHGDYFARSRPMQRG